jgi:hypothetical protein
LNIRDVFLGLAVLAILCNAVIIVLIMAALNRRGQKTNMLLVRLYVYKYVSAYKQATQKETGKPGRLYHLWVFTNILALATALAGLLVPRAWF